jgi:hypothetical protein
VVTTKRYRVLVDDNYHYQNEDERYEAGAFDDYADALAKCKAIVEECLQEQLKPGMTAEQLYSAYVGFGEDPWVLETPDGVERFSAWDYARERSREICATS